MPLRMPTALRCAVLSLCAAPGLLLPQSSPAREPVRPPRSVSNVRQLLPDILFAPRQRRRATHRGWEIRGMTYTVVSTGSEAEAMRTAEQFERA